MARPSLVVLLLMPVLFGLAITTSCGRSEGDFENPESFIVDPETGHYYVSNVNGRPSEADKNGYITRLNADLKVSERRFIQSTAEDALHAPKGMAIVGNTLYVTDIRVVHGYDKTSGEHLVTVDFAGHEPRFLNDLCADDSATLYVSEMSRHIIFKIDTADDHRVSVLVESDAIRSPNGLVYDRASKLLYAACWGGDIRTIDADGDVTVFVPKDPARWQNLDGIDFDAAGNLYVSDFTRGQILRIAKDKSVSLLRKGYKGCADISVDRKKNVLLVPVMNEDRIDTIDLSKE